jgi:hypothetical protein
MSYKLKHESISNFSTQVAALICSKLFTNRDKIDGESLTTITKVRQVNSFVVRSLFGKWQEEMQKLKSPYFDFENKEVKKGLNAFMDVLSNHISVGKSHLEPLLVEALEESILLMFDPQTYVKLSVESNPDFLKGDLKYIKCHQKAFKTLSNKEISVLNFDHQMEKNSIEFESMSQIEFLEQIGATDKLELLFSIVESTTASNVTVKNDQNTNTEASKQNRFYKPEEQKDKQAETINDKFNDTANSTTLAEKLQKKVIKSIDKSLSLNERIMFTNSLFKGDKDLMANVMSQIDTANSLSEAVEIAMTFNSGWKMDGDEIEAFMEVIERKFN